MSERRPVTAHDLFRIRPVSDPQISPDGALVAFVVQSASLAKNQTRSAIWVVGTEGGEPRQLTNPVSGSDRAPRWSPDGTRLAFLSDRGGKTQIWVIARDGGEATCIETAEKPNSAPAWSPDSSQIAFTASLFLKEEAWTTYPGAPEWDRKRAEDVAAAEPGDNKNGKKVSGVKVISRLKFRMDGVGYYGDKRSHICVVPADGSAPARVITSGEFDHTFPTWSPDGLALYCAALRREDADHHNRHDLWRFDLTSGEATLVYENGGPIAAPVVSPDGKYVLFGGHQNEEKGSTSAQLMLLTLATGQAVSLTAPLDRPIGPAGPSDVRVMPMFNSGQWAPDSSGAYFLLADRGESHLFFIPVDGGKARKLTSGEGRTISAFAVDPAGKAVLAIGDGTAPDDLYLWEDGLERRLTDINPAVREMGLVKPERFTYQGADGWPMDGWLIKPVGYEEGKRYPTVLSIHGGPHGHYGESLNMLFQSLAGAGFAVIYTNPRGSQTYGQAFAKAVVGDWGGKDYQDIMAGVDKVVEMGVADPDRLGVMGWSYGGFMTCWVVTHTDRFKAAITGAPVVNRQNFIGTTDIPWFMEWHAGGNPWEPEGEERLLAGSSIRLVDKVVTPTMVVCGEGDLRCPIEQADQFYLGLKRVGKVPTVQIRYPGEFHGLAKPEHKFDRYERTVAWFRYYL